MKMVIDGKPVRINKYLAECGYCSRRDADRLIQSRRVTIDGEIATLGTRVTGESLVAVDNKPLSVKTEKEYIILNKPIGIVCTTDSREPNNIVDYINYPRRLFPIGRLDKDSSGLIILTDDGDIVNLLLRSAGNHEKEYLVVVDKNITDEFLKDMASGVKILDQVTLPCKIERVTLNSFRLTLTQGLNRQIRRMCETLGYRVRSLKRVRIMNITLGDLKPGEWRRLDSSETEALLAEKQPPACCRIVRYCLKEPD